MKKIFGFVCLFFFTLPLLALDWNVEGLKLQIHGYASQGYLRSDHNNFLVNSKDGSFEFNEVGINFSSQLTDKLRVGIQLLSRDLGSVGNNDVVLDWAYGDYRASDKFGIRFGRMKMPYGLYNQGRDVDMLRPSILLPSCIYSEDTRPFIGAYSGIGLYGTLPVHKLGDFYYDVGVGANSIDANHPFIRSIYQGLGLSSLTERTARMKYVVGGIVGWRTPLPGLRVQGTWGRMKVDYEGNLNLPTGTLPVQFVHTHVHNCLGAIEYVRGNLTLAAEYQVDITNFRFPAQNKVVPVDPQAFYVQGTYRFWDKLELSSYYGVYYRDRHDKEGKKLVLQKLPDFYAWQKDWCVSTRYDINSWWLVKGEVHFMDGTAQCHLLENLQGMKQKWLLFAVKTTISF